MKTYICSLNTDFVRSLKGQQGISLIAMAFFLMGVGLFTLPAIQLYKTKAAYEAQSSTDEKIKVIQAALLDYQTQNGHYPCPATMNAAMDTPDFGVSVAVDCTDAVMLGPDETFRAPGRNGALVRTGAVPVRTLGLPDSYIYDGFNTRFAYAITEAYAVPGAPPPADSGAIQIIDGNGNNATAEDGNIIEVVYSMGSDPNGAYNAQGFLTQACDPTARSGENCDFAANAVFMNMVQKSRSENADNTYVHTMSYQSNRDVIPCEDAVNASAVKDTVFLIDTSGSMAGVGPGEMRPGMYASPYVDCPVGLKGPCSRMDVAQWAMRRVMPARITSNSASEKPGKTSLTKFRCTGGVNGASSDCDDLAVKDFSDIDFDNPNAEGYVAPDNEAVAEKLERNLENICPGGNTPLVKHMQVLADVVGNGTKDLPNKITILSDGEDNSLRILDPNCRDKHPPQYPESILCPRESIGRYAREIHEKYPHIQIDIIDVSNNPGLREVAEITGGKYYSSSKPDDILKSLYSSAGICEPAAIPTPVDKQNCTHLPPPVQVMCDGVPCPN